MAFDSFRDFVNALDAAGELIRISSPVATELEITEIADREMKKPGGGRALLFEQPTVNGRPASAPLAINVFGSMRRMAMALGTPSIDQAARDLGALLQAKPPTHWRDTLALLGKAMELRHARPRVVKTGPCQQVVHRFDPNTP